MKEFSKMKKIIILITILIIQSTKLIAQDCDSMLTYSQDDKYSIFLANDLSGKVLNNPSDTMHGMFCRTSYFKSPYSSGIKIIFFFIRCGKMLDASVKVKIEFMDGSTIFLSRSQYDSDNEGAIGIFSFISGGNYGHNYELTMLRTKSISKVSISGNQIDSYTYSVDFANSLDFMLGMGCLFNLTK